MYYIIYVLYYICRGPFLLRRSLLGQRPKNVKITACGDLSSPTVGVLSFAKTLKTSDYSYH